MPILKRQKLQRQETKYYYKNGVKKLITRLQKKDKMLRNIAS